MRHGLPTAAFVAFGLILSTPLWAVSIGDIRPQSRVGEPLAVSIAIEDSAGVADDSIQIAPASAADHALLGMQRPIWLDQMVFRSERDAAGQLTVEATAPVLAPTAEQSFLVQLSWPGHVRLQQISVSLPAADAALPARDDTTGASAIAPSVDLPTPAEAGAVAASEAPVEASTEPTTTIIPTQPVEPAIALPAPIVERPAQTRSGPISVRRGDTLSQIASEWDQDLSLNQRQQLIRERNPQAFINGSINLLRADVRIVLPDPATVKVPTEREANRWYRQALKQAQGLLDNDLAQPTVAAVSDNAAEAGSEPNLTLVAPGQGDSAGAGAGEGSDADAITAALAEAQNERVGLLATRQQLRERLAALTAESTEADARLQVLDARLAAMEAGEPYEPEVAAANTSEADNGWMWWLAALFFWLLLLVVWLRQRAQRQQAAIDAERKEPVMSDAHAVHDTPPEATTPEAATAFDDTFASLAPASASLGNFESATAVDDAEEEYDFLSDSDAEAYQTRLDLAQAYLDMNEDDAARQLLDRVMEGGTTEQRARAQSLLDTIG